jgi:hypothetical protein
MVIKIRRVRLEDLTANTPEPVHDSQLLSRPGGPAPVFPVAIGIVTFLLEVPGPCGPGRCYAAPPGLVKWVNRESFTKPTLWYGSPARADWIWMLKMFNFAASTFSLQARRADTSPAGGDSHRWGGNLLFFFLLFPPSAWFWCVRDRDDGVKSMFDELRFGGVTSPYLLCDRLTHPTSLYRGPSRRQ